MTAQKGKEGRRELAPIEQFRETLRGPMRDEIAQQLPKGVDVDRFIRTALTVVQMQPDLLNANRSSLFGAVMQSAKDGLLPDGREATIQVYNTNVGTKQQPNWQKMAQYMPMVGGLIKKMYDTGCKYIDAAAVYEKDEFIFERGDEPRMVHRPYLGAEDPGEVIAAYAIVKLRNDETKREVMPKRDIEKVREASKASNGPGWTTWYDQFAIKAVLKRIYKQLPQMSEELQRIIDHDNRLMEFDFDHQRALPSDSGHSLPSQRQGSSSRLDEIVGRGRQPVPEESEQPADSEQPAESGEQYQPAEGEDTENPDVKL